MPTRERQRPRAPWLSLAAIFVVACLPMLAAPVLPTIDFYDHLNRFFVLSHLRAGTYLTQDYQSAWGVLPNVGLDVIGVWLLTWIDPAAAPKVVALLIFATQYLGVLLFSRALSGRIQVLPAILCVPLLYSFIFTWGFANFLFGLGLVFWAAAAWLWLRRRPWLASLVGLPLALVIFLTHGVAFALYGILLFGLELGFFLETPERVLSLAKRLALLVAQAIGPGVLFLFSRTVHAPGGVTTTGESIRRLAHDGRLSERLLELAAYRAQTIVRVAEGPSLVFDAVLIVITGALLLGLAARGRLTIPKVARPAIGLGVVLVACVPPALFGVGYVSDRMPLFLALLVVGALQTRQKPFAPADRLIVGALLLTVFVRLSAVADEWQGYAGDVQAYQSVASRIPPHSVVNFINVSLEPRMGEQRRCEMYGPMLVSRYGQAAALFAIPTAQPMRLKGQLAYALQALPPHVVARGPEIVNYYERTLAAVVGQKRFDYSLICDADLLSHSPPAGAVVARNGRFTLLRVR